MLRRDRQTLQIVVSHDPCLWNPQRPGLTSQRPEPVSLVKKHTRVDADERLAPKPELQS